MKRLLILLFALPVFPGFAQWNNSTSINNPIVTTATTDNFPFAVSDGAGGSIVFFEKAGVGTDIYAQKMNADGTIAWGTAGTPVLVCNAASEQYSVHAIADGNGGAFLCWYDFRHDVNNAEIYAQHINGSGTSLWTANGVRLTTTANLDEFEPFLCSDGAGGVIVAWNWENFVDNIQVNAQRLNAAGAALWTANGVQVCTAPGFRVGQAIVPDAAGGAIITFSDTRNDPNGLVYSVFVNANMVNTDVFAQRLSGTGTRLWGDNGLPVCTATGNQQNYYFTSAVPDGAGGVVITFEDGRNDVPDTDGYPTNLDLFAQRLNDAGAPVWSVNGVAVTLTAGNQYFSETVADGANGIVCAWNDENSEHIFTQRLNTAGAPMWALNGVRVSPLAYPSYDPVIAADGAGNYIYAYTSPNSNNLEAQKLNISGAAQWGSSGIVVCNAPNAQPLQQKIVLSDNGAVILAWEDQRNTGTDSYDIYGSKILPGGSLAGTGTFITIAAGNWNDPAIWQGGVVPSASSPVTVRHAVTVTGNASCYSILVEQPNGNLTVNAGITLAVTH